MSRQGAPERFGLEDAVDDLSVVVIWTPAAFDLWKKRLDTLVLLVGEPEATASSGVEAWQNGSLGPKTYANRSYGLFIRQCLASVGPSTSLPSVWEVFARRGPAPRLRKGVAIALQCRGSGNDPGGQGEPALVV
jgi:hypothetical protein